ncbi:hypothetical protein Hdeb2414_s0014g00430561 [Helianthus debilis subsp. tardiflorus]
MKTRNGAYEIIVQIGHACVDEDKGGNKENLYNFFNMVAGGLAGETPYMISAAMKGMARPTYEFKDLLSNAFNVLPSTFLLLQRKSRKINNASLGFLKVLVAKSQAEGLQTHMQDMVEVLLSWKSSNKNSFKVKVKQLLETRNRSVKNLTKQLLETSNLIATNTVYLLSLSQFDMSIVWHEIDLSKI